MKRYSLKFAALMLGAATLAGCGSSTNNNNNNDSGTGAVCTNMAGSATPTVGIATVNGGPYGGVSYSFSPMCVQINRGQSVTFIGDYSLHTLDRNTQSVANANNPLPATPYSGVSPVTFGPFLDAGDFNFVCTIHFFAGTVRVNP